VVPPKTKCDCPGEADLLASRTTVSARGMRKTGSLEKKCGDSPRSVAFRFLGGTHIEGNEEK